MADRSSIQKLYADRAAKFTELASAQEARSRLVSNLRGLCFGAFVIAGGFALFGSAQKTAGVITLIALVAFIVLVVWHARVIEAEDDARRMARVNLDGLARAEDRFHTLLEDGARFRNAAHPYAEDLDVFGPGSLFQRVSTAHTRFGQDALAGFLSAPATVEVVVARQDAVRALAPELETRQRLEAHALAVVSVPEGSDKNRARKVAPDPEPLLSWAESAPVLRQRSALVWAARALPLLTLAGMVLDILDLAPAVAWVVPLSVSVLVALQARAVTDKVFTAVSSTEGAFLRYGAMLEVLENLQLSSSLIQSMQERLSKGGQKPSEAMHEFRKHVGWFDLRHNGLIHPFANVLLLWDIHCVLRLEGWQSRAGRATRDWFRCLGELEALASFAGLSHDEPEFTFPELASDTVYEVKGLGHPLIAADKRITNDVTLPSGGTALLVTGSNMSGKSTMLRAMGLSVVMALAGAPVAAQRLKVARFAVRTSIRISDSLERGISHFYAELNKLKAVMDSTSGELPVFFLLDEILHGTNSRERQIGARWVIAELLQRSATGAVSTHDMGLCELPPQLMAHVQQVHFRESVQNGKMTFDYQLRPGPVTEGNALRLMQTVGLQVPLDSA